MKCYELSHQKNIRDLGGLVGINGRLIKGGCLFRGGYFGKVNEDDIKLLESLHLTDVVDFRSSDEFKERPDYRLEGVNYHNFTTFEHEMKQEDKKYEDGNLLWFIDEGVSGFHHLAKTYRELVDTEEGQQAYRKLFELLLKDEKRVVYFHCSQGKDRAGLAAFFIEMALGVSMKQAKEDYLLSDIAMQKRVDMLVNSVKDKSFYNKEYHQSLLDVFSAKIEYLEEAIDIINKKYGGMEKYLRDVLKVDIEKLRKYYLS